MSRPQSAFEALVAFAVIAAALLYPNKAAVAVVRLVGVVLVKASVHARLPSALTGILSFCVLMAANLGEDADTTAAVAGQLAGALYGAAGIPQSWVSRVAWSNKIRDFLHRHVNTAG